MFTGRITQALGQICAKIFFYSMHVGWIGFWRVETYLLHVGHELSLMCYNARWLKNTIHLIANFS
jgi:hypothetical protein